MATFPHLKKLDKGRLNFFIVVSCSESSNYIIGREIGVKNADDFRTQLEKTNDLNGFSSSEIEGLILEFQTKADELEGAKI